LFVEQESRARESEIFGTTQFLTLELDKVAEQLRQSESKIKSLKERFSL